MVRFKGNSSACKMAGRNDCCCLASAHKSSVPCPLPSPLPILV